MKKFLSLFLVLAMTLSMLTIPTFAEGEGTPTLPTPQHVMDIPTGATTVTYNEVEYQVITTVEQFFAIATGSNYILANDLDFSAAGTLGGNKISAAKGNFILEGNGFALNNLTISNSSAGNGLFGQPQAGTKTTVRNLTVNVGGELKNNSTGVLFGTSAGDAAGSVLIENVTINCNDLAYNGTSTGQAAAVFFAKPRMPVTLKGCVLAGSFSSNSPTTGQGLSGFTGRLDNVNSDVTFENCHSTANISFTNASAGSTGVFVGYIQAEAEVSFKDCSISGNVSIKGGKSGGFVGYAKAGKFTFTDCTAKGTYSFAGTQAAAFFGQIETASGVTFKGCDFDGNIVCAANDSVGPYVGMLYKEGATLSFTDCTSSGTFVQTCKYNASYYRGWATGFVSCAGVAAATVSFDSCSTDMLLMGYANAAGFVASTKNASAQMAYNFNNCTSNVTILSGNAAGAFVAEDFGAVDYNISGCVDNSTIIAASNYSLNSYMDEVNGTVKTYDKASGELAYKLAEAQKAAGVAADYYYGQTVGTDVSPYVGGATVNAVATTYAGTVYSNTATGTETVASNSGNAKAYFQTATAGENLLKTRVIVAMSKANLDKIAAMEIKVTFTLADTTTKTLTLNKWDVDCYYSVYADNKIAEAEDGCVLLAITVKDIPTDQWAGTEGTVAITMTATDADGNVLPEYTLA